MPSSGARVTGLRETVRSLEKYGVEVDDLKAAFSKITNNVVRAADARVPRGATGLLASTIRPAKSKNKSVVRAGSAKVRYAGVRHWGWPARNIAPAPFLAGPADDYAPMAVQEITAELNHLIAKYDLKP